MAFEAITTQEQFDAAISERLRREREKLEKQYSGFETFKEKAERTDTLEKQLEQLNGQLAKAKTDLEAATAKFGEMPKEIETLTGRAKNAERANMQYRIAHETGLPFELAGKLSGDTEEEMRQDAANLAPFVSAPNAAPLFNGENSGNTSPFANLLQQMKGN